MLEQRPRGERRYENEEATNYTEEHPFRKSPGLCDVAPSSWTVLKLSFAVFNC